VLVDAQTFFRKFADRVSFAASQAAWKYKMLHGVRPTTATGLSRAEPCGDGGDSCCSLQLHVHYNFARIHKSLRITPAMACGLSDHVWTLEEIVMMADSYAPALKPCGPYKKRVA
jgi:hypothetical protein